MKQSILVAWFLTAFIVLNCCFGLSKIVVAAELTFGMSAAFSGPTRGLGIEYYRGVMAYLEYINDQGGVNGNTFAVKTYDDGYNPEPCLRNTIRLVEEDKVFALLDYVGTPTTTRMLPVLKKYENRDVFLLFPFTGAEPLRTPPYGRFVFNLRASYLDETKGLVNHFLRTGRERVAVFYQADAYGRNGWDGVRQALNLQGLSMVGDAAYKRGSTFQDDYSDEVAILAENKPDVVIMVGAYAACAGFIRDARDSGMNIPIASVSFSDADSILRLLKTLKTGREYTANLVFSNVIPSYKDTSLPAVQLYQELMSGPVPLPPDSVFSGNYEPHRFSSVSLEGFLGGMLLVEMVRRMGDSPSSSRIAEVMRSMNGIDLGLGVTMAFGAEGHQGLGMVYYTRVEQGELVPLRDWQRWAK